MAKKAKHVGYFVWAAGVESFIVYLWTWGKEKDIKMLKNINTKLLIPSAIKYENPITEKGLNRDLDGKRKVGIQVCWAWESIILYSTMYFKVTALTSRGSFSLSIYLPIYLSINLSIYIFRDSAHFTS